MLRCVEQMKRNKFHWTLETRGAIDRVQMHFRYHRESQPDNEIGFGIELMPRKWKFWHHRLACRLNICLWIIHLWFDYPYPKPKPTHYARKDQ